MIRTGHPTALSAKQELSMHGFTVGFSSPTRPQLWARGKDKRRFAVACLERSRSEEWRIVPYPEPAVMHPRDTSAALEAEEEALHYDRIQSTSVPA